jgi:hypothetical protein
MVSGFSALSFIVRVLEATARPAHETGRQSVRAIRIFGTPCPVSRGIPSCGTYNHAFETDGRIFRMRIVFAALIVAGLLPLILAWRSHRASSLAHALVWAIVAWLSWGLAFLVGAGAGVDPWRYGALCLTGCAGVAVLGARRPHVFAWNFVALGLFAVMILPLAETLVIGTHPVDALRIFFMAATIAVGILNYLPTRLAPAALLLATACTGATVLLFAPAWLPGEAAGMSVAGLLTAVPWVAWSCLRRRRMELGATDRLWLEFRDAWGLMWGQRVREQFNRAAENAGWPVTLTWSGLRGSGGEPSVDEAKHLETLRAILQRFVASDQRPSSP